jgi:hypothetical protein
MANADYDDAHGGYADDYVAHQGAALQRVTHVVGALMTVGVIVGVGIWGYKIAVRDVSGIPVVRALEGPLRSAPVNPGGTVVDHQGLAVNAIPAVGTVAPVAEELALAPRAVDLAEEDLPGLAAAPVLPELAEMVPWPSPGLAPLLADNAMPPVADLEDEALDPVSLALAEALAGEAGFEPSAAEMPEASRSENALLDLADALAAGAEPFAAAPEGAIMRSLRPQRRRKWGLCQRSPWFRQALP